MIAVLAFALLSTCAGGLNLTDVGSWVGRRSVARVRSGGSYSRQTKPILDLWWVTVFEVSNNMNFLTLLKGGLDQLGVSGLCHFPGVGARMGPGRGLSQGARGGRPHPLRCVRRFLSKTQWDVL